ncbi:MAG: SseB family protein [Solobacterium sp.]|nr:SseB family protein [Solobacterium sp.]
MTLAEAGCRPFYRRICALELTDSLRKRCSEVPDIDEADCLVVYGYADDIDGLIIEVLGAATGFSDTALYTFDAYDGKWLAIPAEEIKDVPFKELGFKEEDLPEEYRERIEALGNVYAPKEIEDLRLYDALDDFRDPFHPDIYEVLFVMPGLEDELCRVRLDREGKYSFYGTLVDQPEQDFGVNAGDMVEFWSLKLDENSYGFAKEFEVPSERIAELLEKAVDNYYDNMCEDTSYDVLALLEKSELYMPVRLDEEAGNELYTPYVVEHNDLLLVPVFTDPDTVKNESYDSMDLVSFSEIRDLVLSSEELGGIVLNLYTVPFGADREILESMSEEEE